MFSVSDKLCQLCFFNVRSQRLLGDQIATPAGDPVADCRASPWTEYAQLSWWHSNTPSLSQAAGDSNPELYVLHTGTSSQSFLASKVKSLYKHPQFAKLPFRPACKRRCNLLQPSRIRRTEPLLLLWTASPHRCIPVPQVQEGLTFAACVSSLASRGRIRTGLRADSRGLHLASRTRESLPQGDLGGRLYKCPRTGNINKRREPGEILRCTRPHANSLTLFSS